MDVRHKNKVKGIRVLTLALTVLFVLFVAQALSHTHAKGQNEAACQTCQAAQLGSPTATGAVLPCSPFAAIGYVQPFILAVHQKLFVHDSPSRAPPAA
jgi:hypothetical protein